MLLKSPYVRYYKAGDCMVEQTAKRKVWFFFLFWLEEFHSIVLGILMKLNLKKTTNEKKKENKTEIQINKEPKLRIKSEITVIIFAVDKGKARVINFMTLIKV